MKATVNPALRMERSLDVPFKFAGNAGAYPVGVCVKTLKPPQCLVDAGVPDDLTCGIVAKNTPDECVIIGHGWTTTPNEQFVWTGTREEMLQVWMID